MKSISTVIGKVIPKLRSLQENPEVYIISVPSASKIASPFEQENFSAPSKKEAIPEKVKCIFSEKPEIITKNNQIMTIKVVTFFISELDYGKKISYVCGTDQGKGSRRRHAAEPLVFEILSEPDAGAAAKAAAHQADQG